MMVIALIHDLRLHICQGHSLTREIDNVLDIQLTLNASPFFGAGVSSSGRSSINLMNRLHSPSSRAF